MAHGLIFGCRLASFAPFSNLAAPVAARWHWTAPTTELRKTYSEFAPSRPRSFRQCQFSGDAEPAVSMIATKKYSNTVLSADERRSIQTREMIDERQADRAEKAGLIFNDPFLSISAITRCSSTTASSADSRFSRHRFDKVSRVWAGMEPLLYGFAEGGCLRRLDHGL